MNSHTVKNKQTNIHTNTHSVIVKAHNKKKSAGTTKTIMTPLTPVEMQKVATANAQKQQKQYMTKKKETKINKKQRNKKHETQKKM